MDSTYVACEEDIGFLVSGWCGDSSIEFAGNVGLSFFSSGSFANNSSSSSVTANRGGSIGGGNGDEDTPLAVHVGNGQGELILISLEFELSQGFVDDEGICFGAEFTNLALGDVETDDVGA